MFIRLNRKGQNSAEYAILIGLIVAAAALMQTYVGRGLKARIHDGSDDMVSAIASHAGWGSISSTPATLNKQWEPGFVSSQNTRETQTGSFEEETFAGAGAVPTTRKSKDISSAAANDYREFGFTKE